MPSARRATPSAVEPFKRQPPPGTARQSVARRRHVAPSRRRRLLFGRRRGKKPRRETARRNGGIRSIGQRECGLRRAREGLARPLLVGQALGRRRGSRHGDIQIGKLDQPVGSPTPPSTPGPPSPRRSGGTGPSSFPAGPRSHGVSIGGSPWATRRGAPPDRAGQRPHAPDPDPLLNAAAHDLPLEERECVIEQKQEAVDRSFSGLLAWIGQTAGA